MACSGNHHSTTQAHSTNHHHSTKQLPQGCLIGEGDAQGLGCGADRETPKSGRKGVGWGSHGQDGGFSRIEVLPCGPANCCKSTLKSLRTLLVPCLEEGHAVIGNNWEAQAL